MTVTDRCFLITPTTAIIWKKLCFYTYWNHNSQKLIRTVKYTKEGNHKADRLTHE